MRDVQAENLSSGRAIKRRQVSKSHPRSIFVSSILPSAINLSMETSSCRGMSSLVEVGRPIIWMAIRTAAFARGRVSGSSRAMVVVSSI